MTFRKFSTVSVLGLALFLAPLALAAADPSGTHTGTVADLTLAKTGQPTVAELADQVGHLKVAINFVWLLVGGFLVMFMQAGFALVETGMTRAKNVAHTMAMNLFVYAIGILCFWAIGYGLQMGGVGALSTLGGANLLNREFSIPIFGKSFGFAGGSGFFLVGHAYDVGVFGMFLFQMVFMDTAATIPTGTLAERWRFKSFCLFSASPPTTSRWSFSARWSWRSAGSDSTARRPTQARTCGSPWS